MRIHKKVLIVIVALLIFIPTTAIAIAYFALTTSPQIDEIHCKSFTKLYPNKDCGYISDFTNKDIHKIIGSIRNKHETSNKYTLDLQTHNSQGEEVVLPISISDDPLLKYLTLVKSLDQISKGEKITTTETFTSSKKLYDKLKTGDEVVINIFIPKNVEITQSKSQFGNLKEFNCNANKNLLIKYLIQSTKTNLLNLKLNKLTSGCDIYTMDIEKIKNEK